jgi:hypothetical protein
MRQLQQRRKYARLLWNEVKQFTCLASKVSSFVCSVRPVIMCFCFEKVSEKARNVWWFTCLEKEDQKGCFLCKGKWGAVTVWARKMRSCASSVKKNETMLLFWQGNVNGAPTLPGMWLVDLFKQVSEKVYHPEEGREGAVFQHSKWEDLLASVRTVKRCTCSENEIEVYLLV